MNFKKVLTPRDTEEIKPGLFIQKTRKGYKQIHPAVWNDKVNYKNLLFGHGFLRSFIWFAILMFIAWSYFHDVETYQEFYEEVSSDPVAFCSNVSLFDLNQNEDSYTISNNDGKDNSKFLPE
ncbi:hypothetical protein LCGC14_0476680 [marine sediment metagenome]|uniref:Uncharacterized protein n=1 Tax=marine sediment metagenome TaxID=412755 RepID=A0A0F9SAP0_9ZZZZ|nr:hypothetical protein [bacterium]